MFRCLLLCALLVPLACLAQQSPSYKTVSLDEVFAEWDATTRTYPPGMSVMQPQKLRLTAKYVSGPQPCSPRALEIIFNTLGKPAVLKQVSITNCIKLSSAAGRPVVAWVQDVLVPGLNADVQAGAEIDLRVDLLAYGVGTDRSHNMPYMLVSGFDAH